MTRWHERVTFCAIQPGSISAAPVDPISAFAAGGRRLFAFLICDGLVPTSDLPIDGGTTGDGVIDLPLIRS